MKMTVMSMEYTNIRKFSSLKVNFTDEVNHPYKNSFIMMGNGTGKTTTITLIKGLLDGSAAAWSSDVVRSYSPAQGNPKEGSFKITVKFDEKTYIYVLSLNYETGKAETLCATAIHGGLGPRKFPTALNGLFTQEFVRRFVFDGEQATKALDNKSNEAEEAIKYLYRLDVFDEISRTNRQILTAIQDAEGGARGTSQSVSNLRTRQTMAKTTISRLTARQKELQSLIEEKQAHRIELETQIAKADEKYKGLNRDKIEAANRRNQLKQDINLSVSQILDSIKTPYYVSPQLCARMYEFGDSMTKLKLPKTISKDFFKELAHAPVCICGHNIGDIERKTILENADRYLGSDQQAVLNNIKSNLMNSNYDSRLADLFSGMNQLMTDLKIAEDNLLAAEDKLAKAGGEEAIKMREDRDNLIDEIGHLDAELNTILSKDDSNPSLTKDNNLHKAKALYDDLEAKITSATRTHAALGRKEVVDSLIDRIKLEVTLRLKHEIIKKANDKLRTVITDDTIEIESIDKYIRLRGKTGASEGQTLSIAYCFLGTMFEDSELQFPFIIDSPAGKMDYVKRRAVANILPSLFNQMIAFVTSAEVEQFADQFYEDPNSQFITIIADPVADSLEIHPGKEYFDIYQRDHREEENHAL